MRRRLLVVLGLAAVSTAVLIVAIVWLGAPHAHLDAPEPSHFVVDRDGRFLAQFVSRDEQNQHGAYGFWYLDEAPARVVAATIAIEDQRFYQHPGIDPIAIARAAWGNVMAMRRTSGASTLAMQIARMQFARAHDDAHRSYRYKLREAATAVVLTWRYRKEDLLKHYLRIVPYGNRIHGIKYAARAYLAKPVADLSWAEIAFLAAIPQAPGISNPYTATGRARARARGQRVLLLMAQRQLLSPSELAIAQQQLRNLRVQPRLERPFVAMHAIVALARTLPSSSASRPTRASLDLTWQGQAHDRLVQRLQQWHPAGAENAAAMIVDLQTLEVVAHVGSSGYWRAEVAGALDYTRISRSPGSTLKPFLYALALERGLLRPDSLVLDAPSASGVANADHRFFGPMLPRQALANSRNTPAVRVLQGLGADETFWALRRFGIHSRIGNARQFGVGLALGAMPTTLARLMRAYAVFGNDGYYAPLRTWAGQRLVEPTRQLPTATARLINQFLADPQARLPTFSRLGATQYPFEVALKTGTSQGYRDAWTIAWTPRYLVGTWVGRADARRMRRLGGANSAAWLARDVLLDLPRRLELKFAVPPAFQRYSVCAMTGRTADGQCPRVVEEWLAEPPRASPRRTLASPIAAAARPERGSARVPNPGQTRPRIRMPADGLQLVLVPNLDRRLQSIALQADPAPSPRTLVWYLDGAPYARQRPGETLRWPIQPGRHQFEVEVVGTAERSRPITVHVRG